MRSEPGWTEGPPRSLASPQHPLRAQGCRKGRACPDSANPGLPSTPSVALWAAGHRRAQGCLPRHTDPLSFSEKTLALEDRRRTGPVRKSNHSSDLREHDGLSAVCFRRLRRAPSAKHPELGLAAPHGPPFDGLRLRGTRGPPSRLAFPLLLVAQDTPKPQMLQRGWDGRRQAPSTAALSPRQPARALIRAGRPGGGLPWR